MRNPSYRVNWLQCCADLSLVRNSSGYNVWTWLFYSNSDEKRSSGTDINDDSSCDLPLYVDRGPFSWLLAIFKIRDVHILHKCGQDALHYLTFQRYLVVYMCVICILSITVILPVNFQGGLAGPEDSFTHTTILNIDPTSPMLWVHAGFAPLYLIIIVLFLKHYHANLQFENEEHVTRTVMICEIRRDGCVKELIIQHFQEAYPEIRIQDVQFAFNVAQLMELEGKRQAASEAVAVSSQLKTKPGQSTQMHPFPCGYICCCGPKTDCAEFYKAEEKQLIDACEAEKDAAFKDTLGIAFVTFQTDEMAHAVVQSYLGACGKGSVAGTSSLSGELMSSQWEVKYAPSPEDIYWENLSSSPGSLAVKSLLVNGFLFIALFFFTTPAIIITSLDDIFYKDAAKVQTSPVISEFLPTLLLWTFSAILPAVVAWTDRFLSYWTRSEQHHSQMKKTFILLIFMVLILPSLGLTRCLFLPDSGAFFVNYVVTSALIGCALEIIRFPELFMYACRMCCSRSAAEHPHVRKTIVWEFQFGVQYAWMLTVFAVTIVYSLSCPLVVPAGLLYLTMKHAVDRYNIYFAYAPSKISRRIHATGISYVVLSVVLLQMSLLFFSMLRIGTVGQTAFLGACLLVTIIVYVGRMTFGWFNQLSPSAPYRQFQNVISSRAGVGTLEQGSNQDQYTRSDAGVG
ncbi:PREDICTED: CSC1-like protein 2 [Priapulus caudatus]|uniref:CSC1-like protein 2 n=1 Tax=Priapulus caudatus TaxID=37621 RepID=A0ABM1DPF1_PRICU|nr:PREDICTED: CSC1-like protein 2 [Priapulus caudatus]